ncbi:DUF1178 family protein [Hydrogenophilus thiooxidans]|uniref:DUF1178 family protein n=1 Tax=Hydrogenophilus thiooxidans TaxID=2820326 RepID=UPI001C247F23|nr:DUF1178 family protein [Hydrogenophilus thiooxidans]
MIVFDLACDNAHRFELWVPSAEALDQQITKGWVTCPHCGTQAVRRLPPAPAVHTASKLPPPAESQRTPTTEPDSSAQTQARLWKLLQKLKQDAHDVGDRFPEEARRIHAGEAPARPIKGQASRKEVASLLDEGILVVPLPPDPEQMH